MTPKSPRSAALLGRCLTAPIVIIVLSLALGATASAESPTDPTPQNAGGRWGVSIWGLSYHPDHSIEYEHTNWGLGVRYYARPPWRWLGGPDNRVFVEGDVLRNSNGGVVLPLSAGAEYRIVRIANACRLFAVGALTVAYYENPRKETSEVKFGPVPGLAIGCGHLKFNVSAVLSASRPLAAVVGSMTIVF